MVDKSLRLAGAPEQVSSSGSTLVELFRPRYWTYLHKMRVVQGSAADFHRPDTVEHDLSSPRQHQQGDIHHLRSGLRQQEEPQT
jgi:hypothetical protein